MIDLEIVQKNLEAIRKATRDPETAHQLEDSLYKGVLTMIAMGTQNPSQLAKEALKAKDIEFHRWYA